MQIGHAQVPKGRFMRYKVAAKRNINDFANSSLRHLAISEVNIRPITMISGGN